MPTPSSTNNLVVPKGKLYIATFSGGAPGAYSRMGNCPSVEYEPAIERLPHYDQQSGFRTKDKNPVVQKEYMVRFQCDEIASVNLSKFLQASISGSAMRGLQSTEAEYALKFISNNPIGPNYRWDFWRGTLQPNGPAQLIGDEWQVMDYLFEGLTDVVNQVASPYFTVTHLSTTTTTTTTTTT